MQRTKRAGLGGLLGGGLVGGALAALGYGLLGMTHPLALAAAVAVPALAAAWGAHRATGPDHPVIPNLMHFIWLGGALPADRRRNILAWKESAPGVRVQLWLDEHSTRAMGGDVDALRSAGITVRQIASIADGDERFAALTRRLPTVRDVGEGSDRRAEVQGPAAAAVSDVARLEILSREGGHYMDSDNLPGRNAGAFKDMTAPQGFRLGWGRMGDSSQSLDEGFSNDAMSAVPGADFIRRYREHAYAKLGGRFRTLDGEQPAMDVIAHSADSHDRKRSVMTTTGPDAMREVALGIGGDLGDGAARDLERAGGEGKAGAALDIGDFKTLRELSTGSRAERLNFSPARFAPGMRALFGAMGYTSDLFTRFSGGSWHGENDPAPLT